MKILLLSVCAVLAFAAAEDSSDDGSGGGLSCVEKYRECSKNASFKERVKCGLAYLKCRGKPLTQCLKSCHHTRKTCTKDANGWEEHKQCAKNFGKCVVTCRPGPHDDEMAFDEAIEEDFEDIDDGSGGPDSCVEQYRKCKAAATSWKEKTKCGLEYLKCRGTPLSKCLKSCHETRKTCSKEAKDWREHFKCVGDFGKCASACRPGPHDDDMEFDEAMEEDLEDTDDGSGGPDSCVEQYRQCKAAATSWKEKTKCGLEYLKCRGTPLSKCLKSCHETRKTCSKEAKDWREHLKCVGDFGKCASACRPGPHGGVEANIKHPKIPAQL